MRVPLIIDGRNALDPDEVRRAGFAYEAIGRPRQSSTLFEGTVTELGDLRARRLHIGAAEPVAAAVFGPPL
jgi:hypothetical protein